MKDKILINKNLIPYSFNIMLSDIMFEIQINYNETADLFTVTLYKEGKCLCAGEPIIYGARLFNDIYQSSFPPIDIIPIDESGESFEISFNNFNKTVFLCVDDEEGEL